MSDSSALSLPTPGGTRELPAPGNPDLAGRALSTTIARLHLLRFPLAISVLFFHSARGVPQGSGAAAVTQLEPWAAFVQGIFAHALGGIRMPAFFAISGFLFFAGCTGTRQWLAHKLAGRVRGLLVPLLAWNAMMLLLLLALQAWPVSSGFFSGVGAWSQRVADYGGRQLVDALVGLNGHPIVYPLWFLRDLLLMSLAAPLFLTLPRDARTALVAVFGAVWLTGAWPYQVPTVEACFFWFAGAQAALHRSEPEPFDRHARGVFAALAVLVAAWALAPPGAPMAVSALLHLAQLAALAALLVSTKFIEQWPALATPLRRLAAPSFFVFVAHEPLLTAVRRLLHGLWPPESSAASLGLFFVGVGFTSLVLLLVFFAGQRWAPRTLALLTGGRSKPRANAGRSPNGLRRARSHGTRATRQAVHIEAVVQTPASVWTTHGPMGADTGVIGNPETSVQWRVPTLLSPLTEPPSKQALQE